MSNPPSPEVRAEDPQGERFYARTIPRMLRIVVIAAVALLPLAIWIYQWPGGMGFAAGAAISYVNFRVLARGVEKLSERIVNQHSSEHGRAIVFRFVVRYALVAVVAYAIFKGSALAFRGFLWGLVVPPVAALMAEAVAEGYVAFRRNS